MVEIQSPEKAVKRLQNKDIESFMVDEEHLGRVIDEMARRDCRFTISNIGLEYQGNFMVTRVKDHD